MQQSSAVRKTQYDLERFEQHAPVITRVPKKERVIHPAKIMFTAALIIGMISVMLYGRVQITEMGQAINAAQTTLAELQSEGVRMETELESMMSLKSVEEISVGEYGMVKPDASQVTYLQVQHNRVEAVVTEDTPLEKIVGLLEKIGFSF
ncbi:MAG: hypothetical protein IJD13_04430 [Oscillospiraceae bacterium]|nr:hypothetical protein [Oscillospiraceae bacterium]